MRLKKKWGVGPLGVFAILLTFSLAGMTVVQIRAPLMAHVLPEGAPDWAFWVTYLFLVFPIYQISLLFYALVLGQFPFFWKKQKKMIKWVGVRLSLKGSKAV